MAFAILHRLSRQLAVSLSGLLLASAIQAEEAVTALSLRLETGTHVAAIRAASMDAAGRFLLTASEDKSARVWDTASGTLLSIFRPPSTAGNNGNNGKLFAAAMAPDGLLYATAGWSAGNDLYLVGRSDGQIIHRIAGLPNIVTHLAFSPDGKTLAVGLWGRHGLRVFFSSDGWQSVRELKGDADYSAEVNASAWSADGKQLMVSTADGYLRTYQTNSQGVDLRLSAVPAGAGTPHGLAFSPDGKTVAAGASDQSSVTLIDAATLKTRKILTPPNSTKNRGLNAVAWSADGKRLFAAGAWTDDKGRFAVCNWAESGAANPSCTAVSGNTITALQTTSDGKLLYAAADPVWGMLGAQEQSLITVASAALDFRNLRSKFRLAPDASALTLRDLPGEANDAAFDTRQTTWAKAKKDWQAPRTVAGKTNVDNWFEQQRPQINGKAINLDAGEWSLSAAVAKSGEQVAIATNHNLRLYDRNARERWRTPAPGTPWQVNLSDDGRWLVAAFSDGTLRWYRQQDGSEQLAVFPHPDGRRWVAWTPSGDFAASPGGEDLVGWQLDRGEKLAADFFPASRFRGEYYRPDLISEVVNKGGVEAALAALARDGGRTEAKAPIPERLPPSVRILGPDDMSSVAGNKVVIRLAVRSSTDAPANKLLARVNGQLVQLPALSSLTRSPGNQPGESIYELPIPLPAGESKILTFAENKHGVSPEAALRIKSGKAAEPEPPPAPPSSGPDLRPALYVMAIGVSNYSDPSIRLEFAAKDSRDLSNFLKAQEGGLYRKVTVRNLTDASAKRDDILDGLEWIRRELTARDVAIIFLAGHGVNDADGVYYYLPQDVDIKRLKRTAVIFTEIRNTLISLPGKALFFIDTCHAGNVLGTGLRSIRSDTTAVVNELSSADNGVIVFAAATGRQFAQESSDWGNGAFTKAILEGLGGRADFNKSGRITHKMLDLYLSERVKSLTEGAQSPVTIVPNGVPDFPLVLGHQQDRKK
jgi:WD40 repeat protein